MLPRAAPARSNPTDQLIVLALGTVVFGLLAAELLARFRVEKLGGLFMILAWYPLLATHEAGHGLMASAVGFRVCRTVIGVGGTLARFRIGGSLYELRTFPISGYVVAVPRKLSGIRWRSAAVFLAGPLAELAVVVVIGTLVGWGELLGDGRSPVLLAARATCIVAILGAVMNLIPVAHASEPHEGRHSGWSDGLGAIQSFLIPLEAHARRLSAGPRLEALEHLEAGDPAGARGILEAAVVQQPDAIALKLMLADVMMETGDVQAAGRLVEPLVVDEAAAAALPADFRPAVLAVLASAEREVGTPEALEAADEHSAAALELAPKEPPVVLARAAVSIELGQLHRAQGLLDDLGELPGEPLLADEADCWRAILAVRRGQAREAREMLQKLEARRARGRLLERLRREVGSMAMPVGDDVGVDDVI